MQVIHSPFSEWFLRPLMSHDDMESWLFGRHGAWCKSPKKIVDDEEIDFDDDYEPPLETDYPYVEGEDFIRLSEYKNKDDED